MVEEMLANSEGRTKALAMAGGAASASATAADGNDNDGSDRRATTTTRTSWLVSSMTFATNGRVGGGFGNFCDCDECDCFRPQRRRRRPLESSQEGEVAMDDEESTDVPGGDPLPPPRPPSFVPDAIREAIERHRQQKNKKLRMTLPPTRRLLGRHYCNAGRDEDATTMSADAAHSTLQEAQVVVSAWEWELPFKAEPSLEFGNTHRLVWVRRCPGMLQSIADNSSSIVVGSSEEEASRVALNDWTEGSVIFVPSNGGKAVGYVHAAKRPSPTTTSTSRRDAAMDDDDDDDEDDWDQLLQDDEAPPGGRYATLLVVKLPDRLVRDYREVVVATSERPSQRQQLPTWLAPLLPICRRLLLELVEDQASIGGDQNAGGKPRYTILKSKDAQDVKVALSSLLENEDPAS